MNIKSELRWLIFLSVIGFIVYANSLGGEFVYDDNRQIVRNPLIQDIALVGKALTSDVWAFKGDGNQTASNYWRPTFTAWQILNYQVFGLSPFGWHLLNVLLHIGVCLLAFLLLRRWNLSALLSFAITLIFAVHPVHVESIAWISGSPDLLFALFFLASLWFAENTADNANKTSLITLDLLLSLVFYALALGAKEVAMLCFPLYFLVFSRNSEEGIFAKSNIFKIIPFVIVAVIYFFSRWTVLGAISIPAEDAVGFGTAVLSAPSVFVFYLKQIFFPLSIGANYPLRPTLKFDFFGFVLPLIVSILACAAFYLLAKRSFVQKIGLALFILPLLPIFNITAFLPEQIVHDRYLYLPLLGFLLLVLPFLQDVLINFFKEKGELYTMILAVVLSLPLAFQTFLSNLMWINELSLWSQTVKVDEKSAFNWSQLGVALYEKGKNNESIEAFNNSLDIKATPNAYLGRAQSFIKSEKFEEAVLDLQKITEMKDESVNGYTLYQSYEALAATLQRKKDFSSAEKYLREAIKRLPIYKAALTEKLAIILYQQDRKPEALQELENAKNQARAEFLPTSKNVFLRLGMLYAENGDKENAKTNLQEYLKLTATMQDKTTEANRKQANDLLKKLQ